VRLFLERRSVDDEASNGFDLITPYGEVRFVTYFLLLDAEADGADRAKVARIVPHRDPAADQAPPGKPSRSHAPDDEAGLSP
jgi:hypothetical protein